MKRTYIWLTLGALIVVAGVLSLPSCGHDQKVVSVAVQPASFTFLNPDPLATEQYTAVATYIHPPATKDVTAQAKWKIDDGVATMSSPGLFSPAEGTCGGGNISATIPEGTGGADNIMIGYATVTVNDPTKLSCPGGGTQATLGVQVTPTNGGTITSLTGGINCPGQCISVYPVGASVGLVAMPASGFSVGTWTGCTTSTGSNCTVTVPVGGANVLVTFVQ